MANTERAPDGDALRARDRAARDTSIRGDGSAQHVWIAGLEIE